MDFNAEKEQFQNIVRASEWRRRKIAHEHVLVEDLPSFLDPEHTWIDLRAHIGRETLVYPGCVIMGESVIGKRCVIFPHTTVVNVQTGDEVTLGLPHLKNAKIGARSVIGSMAELNRAELGAGVMAVHHSYVGDTTLGEKCNVGAGFVTANYDGVKKHRTTFGPGSFLGVNASTIAPNEFPEGTQIAAGSTIPAYLKNVRAVPPFSVIISRVREVVIKARKMIS